MTDKPSREDVLRIAGEFVSSEYQDRSGRWFPFVNEAHKENTAASGNWPIRNLYTESQLLAMYAAGAEDTRNAVITRLLAIGALGDGEYLESIRALPITTNTEGEQDGL